MSNIFDSYQSAVENAVDYFDYSGIRKMLAIHSNILAGLNGYWSINIFFKIILALPVGIYLLISLFAVLVFFFAVFLSYIPTFFYKTGDMGIDYLLETAEGMSNDDIGFFEIFFLIPMFFYLFGTVVVIWLSIPMLFGFSYYYDFPAFTKGLKANTLIIGACLRGFWELNIIAKLFALPSLLIIFSAAFYAFAIDFAGTIYTCIPFQLFKVGYYCLDVCLQMTESLGYKANPFSLLFVPILTYFLHAIAICIFMIPVVTTLILNGAL